MRRSLLQIPLEDLLSLPSHLQETALALCVLGRGTAEDVAGITKKARAAESHYLNQLTLMKLIRKETLAKKVYFWIVPERVRL